MSVFAPVCLPDWAWRSEAAQQALRARDVTAIFKLAQQYGGASQYRLAAAVGIPQGRISEILKGSRVVTALEVFERIADGLSMPDHARVALGLAPSSSTSTVVGSEIIDVFPDQSAAAEDIRSQVTQALHVDVLAVRALGLLGMNGSLFREGLTRADHRVVLRVLLAAPDCEATARRAAEIGESRESFAGGIRLSVSRLRELQDVVCLEVYHYDALPIWRLIALDHTIYASTFASTLEGHQTTTYKITASVDGTLHSGFSRVFDELRNTAERVI